MEPAETTTDQMLLRYAGTCRLCGSELPARQEGNYERAPRASGAWSARLPSSQPTRRPDLQSNRSRRLPRVEWPVPRRAESTSAARPSEKSGSGRSIRRSAASSWRSSDDPQITTAWSSGAEGEAALGARLDKHASETIAVMHDRRIPGTKANIDHIVVTAGGVLVVDAKRYVDSVRNCESRAASCTRVSRS